jgi:hypothetical protein
MLPTSIDGVNDKSLLRAWKLVRGAYSRATYRDVIDFFDYNIRPESWISGLLRRIRNGSYEPQRPERFDKPKKKGFYRQMTMINPEDATLYRAIAEFLYYKAKKREVPHAYFEIKGLAARKASIKTSDAEYTNSIRGYRAWLMFEQYRKHTLLSVEYPYLVVTDIVGFFDSISHSQLALSLTDFPISEQTFNLLGLLLERLGPRPANSPSPHIGLPVDEYDASRALAHLVLFRHDARVVAATGQEAYSRYMDDQNIGVASREEALGVIKLISSSLQALNLHANAGKTRILTRSEARKHFHLQLNSELDAVEKMIEEGKIGSTLRAEVRRLWRKAKADEMIGNWDKILKRFYRLAGIAKLRFLRARALRDIRETPELAVRIASYLRVVGNCADYIAFTRKAADYYDIRTCETLQILLEGLLRLEPLGADRTLIREFVRVDVKRLAEEARQPRTKALLPLLLFRFGDRRGVRTLVKMLEQSVQSPVLARSLSMVILAMDASKEAWIKDLASQLSSNTLSATMRFLKAVKDIKFISKILKEPLQLKRDSMSNQYYVDIRVLISLALLTTGDESAVRRGVRSIADGWRPKITAFDRELLDRWIVPRTG